MNKIIIGALLAALVCMAAPAMALEPSTPFAISGHIFDADGNPCNDPWVRITNLNTTMSWDANNSSTSNYYQLALDSDDVSVDNVLSIEASGCSQSKTVEHTVTQSEIDVGGIFDFNITLEAHVVPEPDLIVESITPNCGGYLFGNESNEICAVIKNAGTGNAGAFNVSFVLNGYSETVTVSALAAGTNETVCITDPTIRNAGDAVTITVTADSSSEVDESDESNNASTLDTTVVNNGYKGKRYTGGEDITTLATHDLNGNLVYSVGDSYYLSSYSNPDWTTYNASWTASDLPVTGTVREARLCVPYTWDKEGVMPTYASLSFNGAAQTLDAHYSDEKGWGTSYPYGMLVYDVTADFDASGNVANLTNSCPGGGGTSMRGMLLIVIYEDASEPRRLIYVGEEFDLLYGGSSKCTTPEEATAWAPITGPSIEMAMVADATLITVAPGAGPTEGELLFNGHVWNDVWNFAGATQLGIDERDVASYLESTDNLVGFQSSGDYMEASNAFLVVEYGEVPVSCELSGVGRHPGHLNSGDDLTLTARVKNTGESLVYCQMEWQIKNESGTVARTVPGDDIFTEEAGNGPAKTSKLWTVDLGAGSYTVAGILHYGATAGNLGCTDGPVEGGKFTVV
jgi:hypothetical protein